MTLLKCLSHNVFRFKLTQIIIVSHKSMHAIVYLLVCLQFWSFVFSLSVFLSFFFLASIDKRKKWTSKYKTSQIFCELWRQQHVFLRECSIHPLFAYNFEWELLVTISCLWIGKSQYIKIDFAPNKKTEAMRIIHAIWSFFSSSSPSSSFLHLLTTWLTNYLSLALYLSVYLSVYLSIDRSI